MDRKIGAVSGSTLKIHQRKGLACAQAVGQLGKGKEIPPVHCRGHSGHRDILAAHNVGGRILDRGISRQHALQDIR